MTTEKKRQEQDDTRVDGDAYLQQPLTAASHEAIRLAHWLHLLTTGKSERDPVMITAGAARVIAAAILRPCAGRYRPSELNYCDGCITATHCEKRGACLASLDGADDC